MNSINFLHESLLVTHENQFYKILYESRLIFHKQEVIFSSFMTNHIIKIPKTFNELVFMEVEFHEPRLIFMKIHKNILMSIYRIDPRERVKKGNAKLFHFRIFVFREFHQNGT